MLRHLLARGMKVPRLVIANGQLGIWAGAVGGLPEMAEQNCWNHKIVNVLDALPKKLQSEARALLCDIPYAKTRREAERMREAFRSRYGQQQPKAVETLERDWERLVAFYAFPEAHWRHLRTTNVVESPFAAVRLRTAAGKRYRKVANATALIWRLLMVAQRAFRCLGHPELLAELAEGATYEDGVRGVQVEIQGKVPGEWRTPASLWRLRGRFGRLILPPLGRLTEGMGENQARSGGIPSLPCHASE